MKKIIITVAAFFILLTSVQSQDNEVASIRKRYYTIKKEVAQLKDASYAGKYYCLEINDNPFGKFYPGVGKRTVKINIYYALDEVEHLAHPVIITVVENRAGNMITYKEFLFDKQNLLFAFTKDAYNENIEQRLYCSDGKVLLYTENNQTKETREEVQPILDDAAYYLNSFFAVKQK